MIYDTFGHFEKLVVFRRSAANNNGSAILKREWRGKVLTLNYGFELNEGRPLTILPVVGLAFSRLKPQESVPSLLLGKHELVNAFVAQNKLGSNVYYSCTNELSLR